MSKKILLFCLSFFLLLTHLSYAGDKIPGIKGEFTFVKGVKKFKKFPRLEVLEFFNFSCIHCYHFMQEGEESFLKKYKEKIDFVAYPIFWGRQNHYPSLLYLMYDGKPEEKRAFRKMIFDANFQDQVNIYDKRILAMLPDDFSFANRFSQNADNPIMVRKVNESLAFADELNIHETPTIVINQSIVITPTTTGGGIEAFVKNLEVVVSSLLAKFYH